MAPLSFNPTETSALLSELITVTDNELATHQLTTPSLGTDDFGQGFSDIAVALGTQTQLLHEANLQHIIRLLQVIEAADQDLKTLAELDMVHAQALGGV